MHEGLTLEEALALLSQGVPLWLVADLVPIELIDAGDYVLSRAEKSLNAPLTFSRVRQTSARRSSSLVTLSFTSAGTSGSMTATDEHPFWARTGDGRGFGLADTDASGETHSTIYATRHGRVIETGEGWAFAIDLRPGDKLASPEGIGSITVAQRKPLLNTAAWVYNLDVEGTHTYFVSPPDAPNQCIWVHNAKKGKEGCLADDEPKGTRKNPDGSRKEPGQQYEEIKKAQDKARKDGKGCKIESTKKSKQRDKQEIKDQVDHWQEEKRRQKAEEEE